MNLETAKATLESARFDVAAEEARMKILDSKLTNIGGFAGVSLSISGSVGGSVLASGRLATGFMIALGSALSLAAILLLVAVIVCFNGLRPKPYRGIELEAARERVTPKRLSVYPARAIRILASTYYTSMLPAAREANWGKVRAVARAFSFVVAGFSALVISLILTAVGVVV